MHDREGLFGLAPFHVFAGTGIDADAVTLVDEERNIDLVSGLKHCGLGGTGCGVALEAGFGLGNGQLNEVGSRNGECIALEETDGYVGILNDVVDSVLDLLMV